MRWPKSANCQQDYRSVFYPPTHPTCTEREQVGVSMLGGAGCAPGWYPRLRLSNGSAARTDMLSGSVTRIVAAVVVWLMMMENKYK